MAISGKGISVLDAIDSLSGASTTDATITASDKVFFQDVDDSDNVKTDTVQGILDLAGGGGTIQQLVTSHKQGATSTSNNIPVDNTAPQSSEGTQYDTLAITPSSDSSTLIISFSANTSSTVGSRVMVALFKDSDSSALATASVPVASQQGGQVNLRYEMTSGTTSEITFKIRWGANNGASTIGGYDNGTGSFGGTTSALFMVMEV